MKTADLCRKHGISSATFFKWKAKFGGMDVSDARKLRALEDENRELKKLLAEAMLDVAMLKDLNANEWRRPLRSGRLYRISAMLTRWASSGRARRLGPTEARCAMAVSVPTTRRCAAGCASLPLSAAGSVIAAC